MQASDLIKQAVFKVGLDESTNVATSLYDWAFQALNRVYHETWKRYTWREERYINVSVSLTSDTSEVSIPQEFEAITGVRTGEDVIFPMNLYIFDRFAPEAWNDTGSPANFVNLADVPVATQPSSASAITVTSDDGSDTGTVRLFGVVSGSEAYEDVVLNGTSDVDSTLSFTSLISVSKPQTSGRVTLKAGSTTLGTIPPWAYQSLYRRIRVYPIPDDSYTIYVSGLRRFPALTSDSDTLLLHRAESGIFDLLVAELYEYSGDADRAQLERAKAEQKLETAVNREEHIGEEDTRSWPQYGMYGDPNQAWVEAQHITY